MPHTPNLVHPPADTDDGSAQYRIKRSREVHVHADNLASWEQRYEQTSHGLFSGQVRELMDADIQVFEEEASCATSQHCRPWDGGVWLGLAVPEAPEGLRFMGRPVDGQQLMLASNGHPFDLQVPAGCGLYGVVLHRDRVITHLQQVHHRDWPQAAHLAPSVQPLTVLQRLRLVGMLREVLRSLQAEPGVLRFDASRQALRDTLLTVLADTLAPDAVCDAAPPALRRRQDIVDRARELVMAHPDQPPRVEQLCVQLHVTRRTLQNCFQDVLGMSPAHYLRTVRLNAVRRELCDATPHTTIADIAARWGFWHMGHFSQEYKALFGETPSQTRQHEAVC
ncbi:helix-turn-helix domain-containing protein [Hydrogenophaga sp. IBVHS2]|uniref:helix-turn-helix domain-containing protein n=1 Tax=Hydrogenophaga sp. IBVHS2 TaxID=1985170 RepID=UPI000A2E6636|nr:helix-turn-helix domain-containing protein [Hydrogenophaga sp. IBVHS2]OSZ65757.1 hypothetical protein CAP38_06820 [Hydrogenophaga sp. IBVHS2]